MKTCEKCKNKYEYLVHIWGGFFNNKGRDNGEITSGFHWFDTIDDRDRFITAVRSAEKKHDGLIAVDCSEGYETRLNTVAIMDLVLDGITYHLEYKFGYDYSSEGAEYAFMHGNFSCDCNLLLFLIRNGSINMNECDVECGDDIEIKNFRVEKRRMNESKSITLETD